MNIVLVVYLFVLSIIGLHQYRRSNQSTIMIKKREGSNIEHEDASNTSFAAEVRPLLTTPTAAPSLPPPKAKRKCKECGIEGHYQKNCPSLPCSDCGGSGHVANKCSTRIAAARVSHQVEKLPAVQREHKKASNSSAYDKRKRKESGLSGLVESNHLSLQDAEIPNSAVNRDAKRYQVSILLWFDSLRRNHLVFRS